jgi:hypothetical protein
VLSTETYKHNVNTARFRANDRLKQASKAESPGPLMQDCAHKQLADSGCLYPLYSGAAAPAECTDEQTDQPQTQPTVVKLELIMSFTSTMIATTHNCPA